jgi:hypothetical protein
MTETFRVCQHARSRQIYVSSNVFHINLSALYNGWVSLQERDWVSVGLRLALGRKGGAGDSSLILGQNSLVSL